MDGGEVMYFMEIPIDRRAMHEPMGPVEIRIVNNEGQRHAAKEIDKAMGMDIAVNQGVFCERAKEKQITERCEDDGGTHRVQELPLVIWQDRKFPLDLLE